MSRPYDPAAVSLILGTHRVTEFAADTFISVTQPTDDFTVETGAGGEATVIRNRDERVQIQFTLKQTSPSNQALSAMLEFHKATNVPPRGLMLKDALSAVPQPHVSADEFVVTKNPDADYATGADSPRQWTIIAPRPRIFTSGNVATGL